MKKNIAKLLMPIAALLALPAGVFAADGTIAISGLIAAKGCTISTPMGTDVNLGRYIKSQYATVGTKGTTGLVLIQPGACPVGTKIGVLLEGPADTDNPKLFKVPGGTGQAEGIGLEVVTIGALAQQFIPNTLSQWYATSGNAIALSLRITPISTLPVGSIVAGKLDTPITYTLKYN